MLPLATFHQIAKSGLLPMRADRSALGILPTAALQYCAALTSASAFGWYAFPPISFHVQWDGTSFIWSSDDGTSWLSVRSELLPSVSEDFDSLAPPELKGLAPPFLTSLPQPGVLQIWTGSLVRTRPGWSLLIRPPANIPRSRDYEPYEGIVETDRWFYPLFINLRVIASDRPIFFDRYKPLLQAQPLKRETYDEEELRSAVFLEGVDSLSARDWADYSFSLAARATNPLIEPGRYARAVRKRQREHATSSAARLDAAATD
jgi:hypothetical protein